jgi:hypothetical protein
MALRTITDFKQKLTGGGARPNLFEVNLQFPAGAKIEGAENNSDRFLVKAAALPASNIGPIEIPFRGRILKIAGDRTFDTWTVTILNDTNFTLRNSLERWMNLINRHDDASGIVNPDDYMKNAYVYQLDRNGGTLRSYKFFDIFPTNISQIDLSYDTTDAVEEFTAEFQVQWWEATDTVGNNPFAAPPATNEDDGV